MPEDPIGGAVRNLFDLRGLENDLSVEAHRLLLDLFDDIAAQLNNLDPTEPDSRTLREERLAALVGEVEALTGDTFDELQETIAERGTEVGLQQADWAAEQLRQVIGADNLARIDVDITADAVTRQQIRSIVTEEPFRGAILSDWADRQAENTVFQVRRQVQLGMAQNETTGDIIRRVRGRQAGFLRFDPETGDFVEQGTPGARVRPRFQGGVLSTTTRQAEALVRTAINHTANRAHTATFQANEDVTETWTYTAVLDSRTCITAGTKVLTPVGWKPIEALEDGDLVVGGSGEVRMVEGTRQKEADRLAVVRLSNGETVRCTPDHMFLTKDGQWKEAQDLTPGEELEEKMQNGYIYPS